MLNELVKEWNAACKKAIKIDDKMNADGVTFEFRKSAVNFRGVTIELLSKRRPNSGLAKDAELDPSKGPTYFVTVFVPSTNKIVENIPSNTLVPNAARMVAILQSLEEYDHDAVVAERTKVYKETTLANQSKEWMEKLEGTEFSDQEKQIFIDFTNEFVNHRVRKSRASAMFDILAKYHKQIIGTDVEACGLKGVRLFHPFSDIMYTLACQMVDRIFTTDFGDPCIPRAVISNRFWNADNDGKLPAVLKAARSIYRQMYADCNEKATIFTVVVIAMTKYYEATTGESVAMCLAREAERRKRVQQRKAEPQEPKQDTADGEKPKKKHYKRFEPVIKPVKADGLGNMGELFSKLGL